VKASTKVEAFFYALTAFVFENANVGIPSKCPRNGNGVLLFPEYSTTRKQISRFFRVDFGFGT
jgi:hypothetical protein